MCEPCPGYGCLWCGYVANQPLPETQIADNDTAERGRLADSAASIFMKCLYSARMARFDLLRPAQGLAKYMTKWTTRHDAELHQVMCYIYSTLTFKMVGWIGDDLRHLQLQLFSDSDFVGCNQSLRSTTGVHTVLTGRVSRCQDKVKDKGVSVTPLQRQSWLLLLTQHGPVGFH